VLDVIEVIDAIEAIDAIDAIEAIDAIDAIGVRFHSLCLSSKTICEPIVSLWMTFF
jgi:hypothetical protein